VVLLQAALATASLNTLHITGEEEIGLLITKQSQIEPHSRLKRRVEPRPTHESNLLNNTLQEDTPGEEKKKYRRLQHDISIRGEIRSRYALTLVENTVLNTESVAREVFFSVILPETAFISKFAMEVGGEVYLGEVREKEEAWRLYKEAVDQGTAAGHVGASARHSNRFKVSANTEPGSTVRFYLLYEELLRRKGGIYNYIINISPHQKLSNYTIDVNIVEQNNISRIHVPELKRHFMGGDEEAGELQDSAILLSPSEGGKARVTYRPNLDKLQAQIKESPLQFVLEYEVERGQQGGQLQLFQGYFVHFVAPENLSPMPKHVVFVLDTSGSMRYRKMQQTVNAMKTILGEMRDQDYITIIRFSDTVSVWELEDNSIVPANMSNRQTAIAFVEGLEAKGETNINSALVKALTIVTHVQQKGVLSGVQSMIFFLTDGHPTKGVTDTTQILDNVRIANENTNASIFSLAFGMKTDFGMLKTLSIQNYGFARKIYTAADASLQLEGLYKEVSSPILSGVKFDYMDSSLLTESITDTIFHTFYQGGEMVVAGMVDPNILEPVIQYEITAEQVGGEYKESGSPTVAEIVPISETVDTYIDFLPDTRIEYNFLERLWAYLTVQNLFMKLSKGQLVSCQQPGIPHTPVLELVEQDREGPGDGLIICNNLERALYLSLRYQFVTPLTSLVVVKPQSRENGNFGEADRFQAKLKISSATRSTPVFVPTLGLLILLVAQTMGSY